MSNKLNLPDFTMPFPEPSRTDTYYYSKSAEAAAGQSLDNRREARKEYQELLQNPDRLRDILGLLLRGDYGLVPLWACWDAARNNRLNHRAAVGAMVALYECGCSSREARKAYNNLTEAEKATADSLIDRMLLDIATEWSEQTLQTL